MVHLWIRHIIDMTKKKKFRPTVILHCWIGWCAWLKVQYCIIALSVIMWLILANTDLMSVTKDWQYQIDISPLLSIKIRYECIYIFSTPFVITSNKKEINFVIKFWWLSLNNRNTYCTKCLSHENSIWKSLLIFSG